MDTTNEEKFQISKDSKKKNNETTSYLITQLWLSTPLILLLIFFPKQYTGSWASC